RFRLPGRVQAEARRITPLGLSHGHALPPRGGVVPPIPHPGLAGHPGDGRARDCAARDRRPPGLRRVPARPALPERQRPAGRPLAAGLRADLERALGSLDQLDEVLTRQEARTLRRRVESVLMEGWRYPQPTSGWSVPWPPV